MQYQVCFGEGELLSFPLLIFDLCFVVFDLKISHHLLLMS